MLFIIKIILSFVFNNDKDNLVFNSFVIYNYKYKYYILGGAYFNESYFNK